MPMLPPRPCTQPGCKGYQHYRGKCKDHMASGKWQGEKTKINGWTWQKRRKTALSRDGHLCVMCKTKGRTTLAREVDHIQGRARGGSDDLDNLQSLCVECHKVKTQSESNFSRKKIRKPSIPVVLIYGPPGAGKTTYAKQVMKHDDILIDFDQLIEIISGVPRGEVVSEKYVKKANNMRNRLIDKLADERIGTAYITMTLPKKTDRDWWADRLGATLHEIVPDPFTCLSRISNDEDRSESEKKTTSDAVYYWFSVHSK